MMIERLIAKGTSIDDLTDFERTCLVHCPDPAVLELIGRIFLDTAAKLRGPIFSEVGNA